MNPHCMFRARQVLSHMLRSKELITLYGHACRSRSPYSCTHRIRGYTALLHFVTY